MHVLASLKLASLIFRLPLFALVLVAVPAVLVVVNQRGGLPCFCPMHIGFDVFGAHEFEQVVKLVGLHGQIAVVGGKAVEVADDETFAAGGVCLRVVAAECACGFYIIQPAHAEVGGEPVGKLAVFVGIGAVHIAQRLADEQLGHSREETFAKKPFPRQPEPKHRFSAISPPNHS